MTNILSGLIMLVGAYGAASDTTLHVYEFDTEKGDVTCIQAIDGIANPSFLNVADNGNIVLTANENYGVGAAVSMLVRNSDGEYFVAASIPTDADGPCHIALSPSEDYVVTANYGAASISVIPVDLKHHAFGKAEVQNFSGNGPVEGRQAMSHPHFTSFSPDGKVMIVDDLGLDCLHVFPLDQSGTPQLEQMHDVAIEPGSGPRHIVFDHCGRFAYLINEISGTVTSLFYDGNNQTLIPQSTTFVDYSHGEGSGDIRLSPDDRFLYVSNRLKGDGIVTLEVNPSDGTLAPVAFTPTGRHPRNFNISPYGHWLIAACRDDNRLEIYRRDMSSGRLSLHNTISCPRPVCIEFQEN